MEWGIYLKTGTSTQVQKQKKRIILSRRKESHQQEVSAGNRPGAGYKRPESVQRETAYREKTAEQQPGQSRSGNVTVKSVPEQGRYRREEAAQSEVRESKAKGRRASRKAGFSMSRRISSSYIGMVGDAFLSCLILIIIVFIIYHSVMIGLDVKQIAGELSSTRTLNESVYDIARQKDTEIALSTMSGEILVNSFGAFERPYERLPIWFYRKGSSIYIMLQTWVSRPEDTYIINVFRDISPILLEMLVLFGFTVFLGLSVLLTLSIRGHSITKNVLYPIAEMTRMTKEIKAQNLNLRLNVTNAKDELKELVITFNSMMDRIENAYNKQNQFVSDASHELRTPISVIQGYARMLERWGKEDPEVLQESIEAIRNESENMKELVDKLLFIARNDKDTLTLTKEKFSLSEMMDELVKETRMVDDQHNIDASVEQEIDIIADRNRIKQAMRIFVDNAQKYTEAGKTIEINLKRDGNKAILSVRDEGCGISAEDLQSVFDRFFRADQSRDRNKGGHGLGLSIAKIIVLRHGGKINVKSKVGEGSIFSVILDAES